MQKTDQGTLQVVANCGRQDFFSGSTGTIYLWLPLRRRRAIAPPISSAAPNSSAVAGSGTGAGP